MNPPKRIVISASRRTDLPAFYMPWFMQQLERGTIETVNPFNRRTKKIPLSPRTIHSIVFWSKNFGPFIEEGFGERIKQAGFNLFFNFTVNSESHLLEPQVPPLDDRLDQLERLCVTYGADAVTWRFDPICFYETEAGRRHNLVDFERIAKTAVECGIRRCITSFRDDYQKIRKRTAALRDFRFIDPSIEKKARILIQMAAQLDDIGIGLYACCEKAVLDTLPSNSKLHPAACIDNQVLARLYGDDVSVKRDSGQRLQKGCGCRMSVDIGDYKQHPCYHNCLFCYANPVDKSGSFGRTAT
jgi:hypothetical protein